MNNALRNCSMSCVLIKEENAPNAQLLNAQLQLTDIEF